MKKSKNDLETMRRKRAQRARRDKEKLWQKNGHVRPGTQPTAKPGTKAFQKLQKEWYGKLAKEGFEDIEWAGNPDSPHIKQPSSRGRKLTPGKQLYFAMARNYLTHFRFRHKQEKVAWAMHTDGASYRQILDVLKRDFGIDKSIYWIYYFVQDIANKCRTWNTENSEGLLNAANSDGFADDALLADLRLEECYSDGADYELPIDAGYWQSVPKKS